MVIKSYQQKGKYINIKFDDETCINIRYETFLAFKLTNNLNISEEDLAKLKYDSDTYDIKDKIFDLVSRRLHSKDELRIKLQKLGYQNNVINDVLNYLEEKKYLDDKKFAESYFKTLINKNKSKYEIIGKLKQKGINDELIENLFDKYYNQEVELENVLKLAKKKLKLLKNLPVNLQKEKLIHFLLRKGYKINIIKNITDKI